MRASGCAERRRLAGAAEDRPRSQPRRTRRRRAYRPLAPRRRHDRRHTTLARPSSLREQIRAKEQGGLSGRPLFRLSTRMVAETYVRAEGAFPLIGVGGIDSGGAALTKIRAGASLIQLYSSLIYKGLGLVDTIKNDLASDALAHRARLAVRNRRRRRRHHHRRGLAGKLARRAPDTGPDRPLLTKKVFPMLRTAYRAVMGMLPPGDRNADPALGRGYPEPCAARQSRTAPRGRAARSRTAPGAEMEVRFRGKLLSGRSRQHRSLGAQLARE